jgi:hypothetical protein
MHCDLCYSIRQRRLLYALWLYGITLSIHTTNELVKRKKLRASEWEEEKNWTSLQIINGDDFSVAFLFTQPFFFIAMHSLATPHALFLICLPSPPYDQHFNCIASLSHTHSTRFSLFIYFYSLSSLEMNYFVILALQLIIQLILLELLWALLYMQYNVPDNQWRKIAASLTQWHHQWQCNA